MIPDDVIDDTSCAFLTQLTEPYLDESVVTASAEHTPAQGENWSLFPDMLTIQPATTSYGVDSNHGDQGLHFRWDGTIDGASQPPEYYAYSPEEHITWEQGLEIIEEFDWSAPEAQESSDMDISEPIAATVADMNPFKMQRDGPAGDSQACLTCPTTEARETEDKVTTTTAAMSTATSPNASSAPSGASDNTATPLAPLSEPSIFVPIEAEYHQPPLADVDEVSNDEVALADQLEREMAQNIEFPVFEVEADVIQSHDLDSTILKDTTQESQATPLQPTSQEPSLPEGVIELPEQDSPTASSDAQQVAHRETEADQWEEQLQEAAAEGNTHLIAEPESLDLVDAGKLDNEPRMEESAQDTANEICSANTSGRKRSKATSGEQSTDTETEVPAKKKARSRSPTPTDDAKQSVEEQPSNEAEASAVAPIPRTRKSTSRKSIKESPEGIPRVQDQVMFTEHLQPPEGTIATLDNAKGVIHPQSTDSDPDIQEHLTDATNLPDQVSVSSSQSQRAPRNIVSNRELQALGSTLMPGMHLGLHLRADSRPARMKRSVDTPVQSANEGNGNAFLVDEGMDDEESDEEEMRKATKTKKRPSAAAGRKTPAKKSKKGATGGGRASSDAVGIKGAQQRLINKGDEEDKKMVEKDDEIQDLFPAPKIDTGAEATGSSNASPPIPKAMASRKPVVSSKQATPRATREQLNNDNIHDDEDENDTDELAPSLQQPSRQRKRANDTDDEYIDPYRTKPIPTPAPAATIPSSKKTKKPNPRTSQLNPKPALRSKSPMIAIAVKPSPVAKAVASSPLARNKFGFSPRKTRASADGTPIAKKAVGAKDKEKEKGTPKTGMASNTGLISKTKTTAAGKSAAKSAGNGELDRRVTRRASMIALETAASSGDGSSATKPDAVVAKSKGKTSPSELRGEKDGPKTRRAVAAMGVEEDEKEMETEMDKDENIGKRLRSKT